MAKPRLLFCSYHSYLDPASGAALSTRDLLELLAARGWPCAVLSGPQSDLGSPTSLETLLRREQASFQYRPGEVLDAPCTLYHWMSNGVAVHVYAPTSYATPAQPTRTEGDAFLELFRLVCQRFRPDLLLTYGGHWLVPHLFRLARQQGTRVVFALHNLDYDGAELFRDVDAVLVPSASAQKHYQDRLGLASTALPGPWNWQRVLAPEVHGRHVTFVNPQPGKGVLWFFQIARQLQRRRPDIPLLVVEGRATLEQLARLGLDLTRLKNVRRLPSTLDPRDFYRHSRVVLMPSLWQETLGRVAVEAMLNGIPVLASRRGGLAEVLAEAGFLFDIPPLYTPTSGQVPAPEEVEPWVQTIERLWDDAAYYAAESVRCRAAAEVWRPEQLVPHFEAFFQQVLQRPLP